MGPTWDLRRGLSFGVTRGAQRERSGLRRRREGGEGQAGWDQGTLSTGPRTSSPAEQAVVWARVVLAPACVQCIPALSFKSLPEGVVWAETG